LAIPKVVLASATMVDIDIRPVCVVCMCMCCVYVLCVRTCVRTCVNVCSCIHTCVSGVFIFSRSYPESLRQHHTSWGELPPARIHRTHDTGTQHEHSSCEQRKTVMLCKACVGTLVPVYVCIYILVAWKSEITSNHQIQNTCEDSLIEEIRL